MFIEYAVTRKRMVMSTLFFGEWYPGLVLLFPLSFDRCRTIAVYIGYTLVATIGDSGSVSFQMHTGVFK